MQKSAPKVKLSVKTPMVAVKAPHEMYVARTMHPNGITEAPVLTPVLVKRDELVVLLPVQKTGNIFCYEYLDYESVRASQVEALIEYIHLVFAQKKKLVASLVNERFSPSDLSLSQEEWVKANTRLLEQEFKA